MPPPFDPDAAAAPGSGVFGLSSGPAEARVHLLPVPFEGTTSYRRGTARGPAAIRAASRQVDLLDLVTGEPWAGGIWMAPIDARVAAWNEEASARARGVIERGGAIGDDPVLAADLARVNAIGEELNGWVREETARALAAEKLVGVVGGDHSVAFGAFAAHAERFPGLGVLHFDAHADLRVAFEGFTWSHASILHNARERIAGLGPILQVGGRDLGEAEAAAIRAAPGRLEAVFDHEWADARHEGRNLKAVVRRALSVLPREVYVTFDVDGLEPALCPNTGTPVPGGLTWGEAMLWLGELVATGRRLVGFDLVEVAPGSERPPGEGLDEIVGARLLYRLIGFALRSAG
ncbi:MAG: arginase family protein [Planctomycetota bacterium]